MKQDDIIKEFREKFPPSEAEDDDNNYSEVIIADYNPVEQFILEKVNEVREQETIDCEEHCRIAYERGKKGEPLYFEEIVKETRRPKNGSGMNSMGHCEDCADFEVGAGPYCNNTNCECHSG